MICYLKYPFLYLILASFLTACGSSRKVTVIEGAAEAIELVGAEETTEIDEATETVLAFKKQDTGMQAVTSKTVSKNISDKNHHLSNLIGEEIEFTKYTLGNSNSIYVADLKNTLMFDYDKAGIRNSSRKALDDFSNLYASGEFGKYLYVVGHTDSDGNGAYNYSLSSRRALSVATVLLKNTVSASKLHLIPAGEYLPRSTNKTNLGKQLNRRVEIISADSKALIQSYLRQLICPDDELCERKLLNIFSVRETKNGTEISSTPPSFLATYSPELNELDILNKELRKDVQTADKKLVKNDAIALREIGINHRELSIPIEIRPILELAIDKRVIFYIPERYIIKD